MLGCALLVVVPTGWAMSVRLAALGQGRGACQIKGVAFALFQLAVMIGLIYLDAWWAVLIYVFLMLATASSTMLPVAAPEGGGGASSRLNLPVPGAGPGARSSSFAVCVR